MSWDIDALVELLRKNDDEKGKEVVARLPHIPRPKPGVSVALMGKGIKRPKSKKPARDGARGGG